jgi:hypothetical protein
MRLVVVRRVVLGIVIAMTFHFYPRIESNTVI